MKKMFKSKKSLLFVITLVLITIVVLTAAFLVLANKVADFKHTIGERQFDVIKTADSAEDIAFYTEQSAKLSADKALYDLGQKGGFANNQKCAQFPNLNVWQRGSEECYPENVQANFNSLLNKNLNNYIDAYPITNGTIIPKDNYEFLIYNKTLIGISPENIEINIYEPGTNKPLIGRYALKPSFTIQFDYDIDQYDLIIEQAKEIFDFCKKEENVPDCVKGYLEKEEFSNWKFSQPDKAEYTMADIDRLFLFNVNTSYKVNLYDNNKLEEHDVLVKFALFIKESYATAAQSATV